LNRRDILRAMAGAAALAPLGSARAQPVLVATDKAPMIAGPDPVVRTPVFQAPKGSIDTHTHIFGPVATYPYADNRSYTPPEAPLALFREVHRKIGIDRAVVVNATVHGRDNRPVTDAIAQSAGAYKGIANVDDKHTDKELEDLAAAGVMGCRFTFLARLGGVPDMTAFDRIVDRIKGLGWHVDLYLEAKALGIFAPALAKLPLPYVLDHMGVISVADGIEDPAFLALVDLARRDEKCWIKITGPERASAAGPPFKDAVPFAQKLIEAAPDRVIWGTDWPHPNVKTMPNDGDLVDLVPLYAPDPAMRRKLLIDNAERLFKFKPVV
jgi:predicted TIM-barrel fold metal-dependent hydrolase